MAEQLYLSNDVYVCVTEGHGVFLDLKRDKYSAVMFPAAQEGVSEPTTRNGAPASLARKLAAQRTTSSARAY